MHGGTLSAQSEGENKGSRFLVRLPKQASGVASRRDWARETTTRQSKENSAR